jgi:hypothetical protein
VSWNAISIEALARIIPLNPPKVNINTNPCANNIDDTSLIAPPYEVANQLNIFIPVGTAIIKVAAVK